MNGYKVWGATVLSCLLAAPAAARLGGDDELGRRASWRVPPPAEVRAALDQWLAQIDVPAEARTSIDELWRPTPATTHGSELLERLTASLAVADPRARELVEFCRQPRSSLVLPNFAVLDDPAAPPLVRNNLRLVYGRWLVVHHLYDEALEQLGELGTDDVVDPALLLFYQAATHHRLLNKAQCLAALGRLLENDSLLPRRFVEVARLLEADIEPLEADSLDEVARLMDNIGVRLGHGHAGKRVRREEDDVIAKLDKMIEELEEQQQQQQQGGGAGSLQPSSPMQDSMPGGGSGPGNVDPKRIGSQADWGNLPPKERQEALQQLGKDLPAHYREVIEEYFRKLAQDGVPAQP